MKTKIIFPERIDGKNCPCPFNGHAINNFEDFKNAIKTYFDKEKGYPGLFIRTADPNLLLVFAGHQYKHGEEGKWSIFNPKVDGKPKNWFKPNENILSLLEDKEKYDKFTEIMTEIINAQGGITIKL